MTLLDAACDAEVLTLLADPHPQAHFILGSPQPTHPLKPLQVPNFVTSRNILQSFRNKDNAEMIAQAIDLKWVAPRLSGHITTAWW